MLNPKVGQIVRHSRFEGNMIVKAVSERGVTVELMPLSNEEAYVGDIPIVELLPADELNEA